MNPILKVSSVDKSYGEHSALKDVSFDIPAGYFVALLGLNGAGKTTLFQLLTGLFAADRGSITVDGYDITAEPVAVLSRLGVVFQQPTLDLDMSVGANLRFHASLRGMRGANRRHRIEKELSRAGLGREEKRLCRELSGGNRRKVELARALLGEPSLLLMDEATVGLDPASRQTLLAEVRNLCQERKTAVLWSTHLVDEAETADAVIILHQGSILMYGPPAEIITHGAAVSLADAFTVMTKGATTAPAATAPGTTTPGTTTPGTTTPGTKTPGTTTGTI